MINQINKTNLTEAEQSQAKQQEGFRKLIDRIFKEDKTKNAYALRIYYNNGFIFKYEKTGTKPYLSS